MIDSILATHGAQVVRLTSPEGTVVTRAEFADTQALETAFLTLIGSPAMKGMASKAIGSVLLIWER